MSDPALFKPQDTCCPFWRFRGEKGSRNFIFAKIPRNPLKSIDSDERIQGNPRKSNGSCLGF
jgi:hypothetical protein